MNNYDPKFAEAIDSLFRLHVISKQYDHFIKQKADAISLFEPSRFVYSFFAFNCFYNIKWNESIEKNKIKEISYKKGVTESDKFSEFVDFVFGIATDEDRNEFISRIIGEQGEYEILEMLNGITNDKRIRGDKKSEFISAIKHLITSKEIDLDKLKNQILYFIFLVRNNIFHGSKNIIELSSVSQRQRLIFYSNILISLNELLFVVLARNRKFIPHDKYELSLPLN